MEDEIMLENATEQVRVYPSDYKFLTKEAKKNRTTVAHIIHLILKNPDKYDSQRTSRAS